MRENVIGQSRKPCPNRTVTRVGARVARQRCPILRAGKQKHTMTTASDYPGTQISTLPLTFLIMNVPKLP